MTRAAALFLLLAGLALALGAPAPAAADVKSKAAMEAAEFILKKFGKEAAGETAETLARKLEQAALKNGDSVFLAARQVGPRALKVAAEAGENSGLAYQLMAKYGDNAVAAILSKPQALQLVAKLGSEAAEQLIKHPGVAEPLLAEGGKAAAVALKEVGPQGGRRLAMLLDDGTLKAGGQMDALLDVVGKYGEKGLDFIWRNKGKLAVAATLTAFLANPQPFIDGTKNLADVVGTNLVQPVVTAAANGINWTWFYLSLMALVALFVLVRLRRPAAKA